MRLYNRGSHSLKEKRQILLRIKDKISHLYNVAIAEVSDNDDWKSAVLGITAVGNDPAFVQSVLDKVALTIDGFHLAETLSRDTIVRTFSEDDFLRH
jgi:uncharacterized protein YlxP (DUF503 family)